MQTTRSMMVNNESCELRGEFHFQPSMWREVSILGYIEPHDGDKVYVRNNEVAWRMLKEDGPYFVTEAEPISECEDVCLVSVRSYPPLKALDGAQDLWLFGG